MGTDMNPLALLSIIQLGLSLIGGLRAQQAAAEQQRAMEDALARHSEALTGALNTAAQMANRDFTSVLAPYYSALQGRGLSAIASEAASAGLTGSGLTTAARLGFRNEMAANLAKDLLNLEAQKTLPLLQARLSAAGGLMDAARLRAGVSAQIGEMGTPNLAWLPMLLQTNPNLFDNLFKFNLSNLPNLNPNLFNLNPTPRGIEEARGMGGRLV